MRNATELSRTYNNETDFLLSMPVYKEFIMRENYQEICSRSLLVENLDVYGLSAVSRLSAIMGDKNKQPLI